MTEAKKILKKNEEIISLLTLRAGADLGGGGGGWGCGAFTLFSGIRLATDPKGPPLYYFEISIIGDGP